MFLGRFEFKGLYLHNFQSIGESTRIPFAPIVLAYGPNSAGKSAIYDAFSLLLEALPKATKSDSEFFSNSHSPIDLFLFRFQTYSKEDNSETELGASWRKTYNSENSREEFTKTFEIGAYGNFHIPKLLFGTEYDAYFSEILEEFRHARSQKSLNETKDPKSDKIPKKFEFFFRGEKTEHDAQISLRLERTNFKEEFKYECVSGFILSLEIDKNWIYRYQYSREGITHDNVAGKVISRLQINLHHSLIKKIESISDPLVMNPEYFPEMECKDGVLSLYGFVVYENELEKDEYGNADLELPEDDIWYGELHRNYSWKRVRRSKAEEETVSPSFSEHEFFYRYPFMASGALEIEGEEITEGFGVGNIKKCQATRKVALESVFELVDEISSWIPRIVMGIPRDFQRVSDSRKIPTPEELTYILSPFEKP